jgi:hypothetical protein
MGAQENLESANRGWERCPWAAGVVFFVALVAEIVVALGVALS